MKLTRERLLELSGVDQHHKAIEDSTTKAVNDFAQGNVAVALKEYAEKAWTTYKADHNGTGKTREQFLSGVLLQGCEYAASDIKEALAIEVATKLGLKETINDFLSTANVGLKSFSDKPAATTGSNASGVSKSHIKDALSTANSDLKNAYDYKPSASTGDNVNSVSKSHIKDALSSADKNVNNICYGDKVKHPSGVCGTVVKKDGKAFVKIGGDATKHTPLTYKWKPMKTESEMRLSNLMLNEGQYFSLTPLQALNQAIQTGTTDELRDIIATDAAASYMYAVEVLHGDFPEGIQVIQGSPYADLYKIYVRNQADERVSAIMQKHFPAEKSRKPRWWHIKADDDNIMKDMPNKY